MEGEDDKPSLGDGEEGRGAEEGKYGKLSVFTFVKTHFFPVMHGEYLHLLRKDPEKRFLLNISTGLGQGNALQPEETTSR